MTQPPFQRSDDEIVELTERARSISRDASTKVTSAFRDMISAGAGIAGFAVESAKDLVQYMVRRGQMTADEAEKLIKEAEAAHLKRPKAERERIAASRAAAEKAAADKRAARLAAEHALPTNRPLSKTVKTAPMRPAAAPVVEPMRAEKPVAKAEKPAAKAEKPAAKSEKPAAKSEKPAAKSEKPIAKAAAPAKKVSKPAAKKPAKKAKAKPKKK
jgi:polyhydroxyalkanoate synthesis regulator phasin